MSAVLALAGDANAARAAMPVAVAGGWYRLPDGCGSALFWCEFDRPLPGRVSLWRSRQSAAEGDYATSRVMPMDAFSHAIAPTGISQGTVAALLASVQELTGTVGRLTERLERVEGAVTLPADLRLVAAVATASRGAPFTLVELLDHGHRVEPAVLVAMQEACGKICARRVGIRLAALSKISIPGFQVERLGSERDGAIWKVSSLRV